MILSKMNKFCLPLIGGCLLLVTGCATSISEVTISSPETFEQKVPVDPNKTFFINSVVDERVFDLAPSDPSVPSLDPSEHEKSRAIGRKRNTYGKALGGFILKPGQTVEFMVGEALRMAAANNGYMVLERKEDVKKDTVVADVKIKKFWSWMNPGFWTIRLNCNMESDVYLQTPAGAQNFTSSAYSHIDTMFGKESTYLKVMNDAYKIFYQDLKRKLANSVIQKQ